MKSPIPQLCWGEWTIEVYHILDGNASIILCLFQNIGKKYCMEKYYMMFEIFSKLSVSQFMGYLKGKSTLMIYDRHPELQSKWNKAFWGRE